jgi:acetoin utilization deacetylase AcuC-like enzyme
MPPEPVFLAHPSSLEHDPGPHPEQPARIIAIASELAQRKWLGYRPLRSPPVARSVLEAVHPREYVESLERLSARGGGQLDLDTRMSAGSFKAALHAAGGAVDLVEMLLRGEASTGFSAHRPPGHHALPARSMGFCLFNNVAVAAQHAVDSLGLDRVMIFDWDVHHGNGTNDIFHASDRVLFVSVHQAPLYPGTGPSGDAGTGAGVGFTVNLPVPPGSGDAEYRSLVEHVVVPLAHAYSPQVVLISAGYDAHRDDPLADCAVTEAGYAAMTRSLRDACRALGTPLGGVLEGGYALGPLARSVAATLEALDAADAGDGGEGSDLAVSPLADAARARLARWWKL